MHVEEVALEVVLEVDEDVEDNHSIEARKMKVISHLVVVKILDPEEEADINNEVISLSFNVTIVTNMVILVMNVDQHPEWKK